MGRVRRKEDSTRTGRGKGEGGAGTGQQASASRACVHSTAATAALLRNSPLPNAPAPLPLPLLFRAHCRARVVVPCHRAWCLATLSPFRPGTVRMRAYCNIGYSMHAMDRNYIIRRHPAPEQSPSVCALPSPSSSDVRAYERTYRSHPALPVPSPKYSYDSKLLDSPSSHRAHRTRHPARRSTDAHAPTHMPHAPPITHPPKNSPRRPHKTTPSSASSASSAPLLRPSVRPLRPYYPRTASKVQSPARPLLEEETPQPSARPRVRASPSPPPSPSFDIRSRAPRRAAPDRARCATGP